ncbi:MAG: T9SS type A sorting domain-containing protein [Flavobacteriales bacterium]|nr:T9SS type A sorting domain-containing protein [Flavobacteriales bacterium]
MILRYAALCSLVLPALVNAQWETLADAPEDLTFPVVVELDGNIHVMGGGGAGGASDVHMRYTPATNTWDYRAVVPYLAQQPCGAVLNGKIHYCAGGYPNTGTPLDDHYVYDPATDSWSAAADLPFPTAINEAAAINGKFYVLTGQPNKQLCQSYDPNTNSWTAHASLPDLNFWYGAVLAVNNTIYRFGGGGYAVPVNLAHVYNPSGDNWTALPAFPEQVHSLAGANVGDSLICLAGGFYNFEDLDDVRLYRPLTQEYQTLEVLPAGRSYHSMVSAGGCVYVVGGDNDLVPTMGVNLIRNCSIGVGVQEHASAWRPYIMHSTSHSFTLQLSKGGSAADAVELIDAQGRMVLRRSLASGSVSLNDDALVSGWYAVAITTGGKHYVERWGKQD